MRRLFRLPKWYVYYRCAGRGVFGSLVSAWRATMAY